MATENNLETIGTLLKEGRKFKNLSLEKLSELTKIKLSNLEALEEDRFDQIAAPTYAKGFLKIVAKTLDLSDAELAKMYDARYPQKSKQVIFISENRTAHKPKPWRPKKKIIWFAVVGLGAFAVLLLIVGRSKNVPDEKNAAPAASVTEPVVSAKRALLANAGAAPLQPKAVPALSVKIKAQADVWIRVLTDGKLVFESNIPKNKEEEWAAREKLNIRIARPTDVAVSVNGKELDLSLLKKPVNLVVTQTEVKIE